VNSYHAAVWLDHHEARIFHVNLESSDEATIHAPEHHLHRHQKGPSAAHDHPEDQRHFFQKVTEALQGAQEILVGGPSTAKAQYLKYVQEHAPALEHRIAKVETVDHPTDAQLVAHARSLFNLSRPRV
jgi:stalled ribosome rescue protein Dom34